MKLVLKFTDGVKVTVEDFDSFPRERTNEDFIDVFQSIKTNDKTIRLEGDNGATFNRTGKDLASVELVLV
ncbi:hypothetical protein [Priestia aryabhattai]|uniref:hypothetical protein n=1 Tax=Priestia aryabhattai TaxID=412384 RepID=UPI002E1B2ACD|nr:hypothetical protein [Priestia aryabhattai]